MAYLIETFDKPGALPLRLAVRDKHLAYLEEKSHSSPAAPSRTTTEKTRMEASTWWILKPGHKQRTS